MTVISTGPAPGRTAVVTVIALAIAALLILIGSFALPFGSPAAALLFDHQPYSIFPFPLTIQNMTYMIFAAGMADLFVRWRTARHERALLGMHFLPEDDTSILQIDDLGPVRRKMGPLYDGENGFLPYLIDISITHCSRAARWTRPSRF